MSRNFQLQLIRKALDDLGYSSVADVLGMRLQAENPLPGSSLSTPLHELVASGSFSQLLSLLRGTQDDFTFSDSLHSLVSSLTTNQRNVAIYLILRTVYLEKILSIAFSHADSAKKDAYSYLSQQVSPALSAVNKSDSSIAFASSLTREKESSVLLPLALNPPSYDQLDQDMFNPQVLLVESRPKLVSSSEDMSYHSSRLRTCLMALLRQVIGISSPDAHGGLADSYVNLPDNCFESLLQNAALYNMSKALYFLPPRTDPMPDQDLVLGSAHMLSATKDDLPIHLLHTLSNHEDEVWFTRFSPTGRFLATGALDGICFIYDVADNFKLIAELNANHEDENKVFVSSAHKPALDKKKGIIYFSWEPHERYIVTCSLDTVIRVWNVESIISSKRMTRSMNGLETVSLVSCFTLGERMRTWPCEFLNYDKSLTPHFIIGSPDKVLKVYSIDGTEILDFYSDADEWSSILGEDDPLNRNPRSPVSSRNDDPSSESQESPLSNAATSGASQFNRINDFAVTPDAKVLVTANNDKQVFFYKIPDLFNPAATTSKIASLSLNGRLTSCNLSANGKYMLLSIAPEELQVWDISPLERFEKPFLKQKYLGQSQAIYMVRSCFGYLNTNTMEEELILSGSDDGYIYIWKLETGQLVTRIRGHDGLCNSVDWNRFYKAKQGRDYGKYWCSVGDDKLVKIWGPSKK